jgi:hypothetical protein
MGKKFIKFFFYAGCIFALCTIAAWFGVKYISSAKAKITAQKIIDRAYEKHASESEDEKIVAIAKEVFNDFEAMDPRQVPLLRVRPYVTHPRLPEFLRLPSGVIETLIQKGLCDNASRMLAFLLAKKNFETVQWNIVTPVSAHSVLLVSVSGGRKAFVDPFYGYVAVDGDGKLVGPLEAQDMMIKGKRFEEVFVPLGADADPRFYADFKSAIMAAEGEPLTIRALLPEIKRNAAIYLGVIDGSARDVEGAGSAHNMTPFWNYIGHKYNREWVRVLEARQPVRVEMTLLEAPGDGVLTSTPKPAVRGNVLSWELQPGDEITFRDGLAAYSLKRLNSYIGIDRIALYPID